MAQRYTIFGQTLKKSILGGKTVQWAGFEQIRVFMPLQMRLSLTRHIICWHHACNWVPVLHFQCFCWDNDSPLPLLCRQGGGEMGARVPVIPPLTLFFHVNVAAVLSPGHHLPFFWVWAPSTLDVSHCLRVSKQKVVSRRGFLKPKKLLHQQHEPAVH